MLKNKFGINKSSLFYTIVWICFFLSINVNPEKIYELNIVNTARLIFPFVLPCLLIPYLLKNYDLDYKNNILTTTPFISYIVIVSIFLLINKNSNSYLNIYWAIAMLIPYMYLLFFKNDSSQLKQKLVWSLLLLIFIFTYYLYQAIYPIFVEKKLIHFYGIYAPNLFYIDSNNYPPRSSGMARMALIVSISATIYLLFRKNNFYASFLLFILAILSSTFCLLFQSRTMSLIYLCLMFLLTLIILYRNFIKNYKKCFLLLLIPFVLALIYNQLLFNQNNKVSTTLSQNKVSTTNAGIINSSKNLFTRNQQENFSSNRFENWKTIIEISRTDKFIIGYGFQADRKLINQSVHNVYLYALISGGILGLLLIICISIRSAWTSFFLLFNYSILKKELKPIDLISSFLILLFLLRGLLETSYGIYSIDYLFFIICYFINEVNYRKFKYTKFVC